MISPITTTKGRRYSARAVAREMETSWPTLMGYMEHAQAIAAATGLNVAHHFIRTTERTASRDRANVLMTEMAIVCLAMAIPPRMLGAVEFKSYFVGQLLDPDPVPLPIAQAGFVAFIRNRRGLGRFAPVKTAVPRGMVINKGHVCESMSLGSAWSEDALRLVDALKNRYAFYKGPADWYQVPDSDLGKLGAIAAELERLTTITKRVAA